MSLAAIINNKRRERALALALAALFGLCLCLAALGALEQVEATASGRSVGDLAISAHQQANSASHQAANFNNLENLISELLDDAGNRLKKSRLSSMRQIKQTLRFGRRSDPLMAPSPLGNDPESYELADDGHQSARWLALD